jgi:Domain of unknown function (DUF4167)
MNNNRQPNNNNNNNNRRRGRSNNNSNRPQGNNNNRNGFDYQNRIDNRARGNASQMLEKYKKLAADAQHNDDRVNAEYYLQFADHYFRVLADFRSRQEERQEERRPQRDDNREERAGREDNFGGEDIIDREDNFDRDDNGEVAVASDDNAGQERNRDDRSARPARGPKKERTPRPARRHHSEEPADSGSTDHTADIEQGGFDMSVLPPSISSISAENDDGGAAPKQARKPRARRPKATDDADISTAAE